MKRKIFCVLITLLSVILNGCKLQSYEPSYSLPTHSLLFEEAEEKSTDDENITVSISPAPEKDISEYDTVSLVRVVDGDTLIINLNDVEYRVRLIGIDCPESVNPDEEKNTEEGRAASEFTKSFLTVGQVLYMTADISNTDKYDRLLRYVWIGIPDDSNISSIMLNAIIISEGYAEAKDYEPDTHYSDELHDLQNAAEEQNKGIWG